MNTLITRALWTAALAGGLWAAGTGMASAVEADATVSVGLEEIAVVGIDEPAEVAELAVDATAHAAVLGDQQAASVDVDAAVGLESGGEPTAAVDAGVAVVVGSEAEAAPMAVADADAVVDLGGAGTNAALAANAVVDLGDGARLDGAAADLDATGDVGGAELLGDGLLGARPYDGDALDARVDACLAASLGGTPGDCSAAHEPGRTGTGGTDGGGGTDGTGGTDDTGGGIGKGDGIAAAGGGIGKGDGTAAADGTLEPKADARAGRTADATTDRLPRTGMAVADLLVASLALLALGALLLMRRGGGTTD